MKIVQIKARQILDSRGNPTVETDVTLEDGSMGRASVPSGASTGRNEATELRDDNPSDYLGESVHKAVENINQKINSHLKGKDATQQKQIDTAMIDLDGTEDKSALGANAILAVSLAVAKAAALSQSQPLYSYLGTLAGNKDYSLPLPLFNIMNGGKHGNWVTDIQEYIIFPKSARSFTEALEVGSELFHHLGQVLEKHGYQMTVGDEGGYAPKLSQGNNEALQLISEATALAGLKLGEDIVLGLDVAASELFQDGKYHLRGEKRSLSSQEMIGWLENLVNDFHIVSIEDGLAEDDWTNWQVLTQRLGSKIQLIGDDLLVTNIKFLQKAIQIKAANAILVKPNQIGTLTETIGVIKLAKQNGWRVIISHRSGETEDTTIAHLAVGLATGQIKAGSVSRTDRVGKYNELLRIEESLGKDAVFAGGKVLQ